MACTRQRLIVGNDLRINNYGFLTSHTTRSYRKMYNSEKLQEKWTPILEHNALDDIKDNHRKAITTSFSKTKRSSSAKSVPSFMRILPTLLAVTVDSLVAAMVAVLMTGFDPVLRSRHHPSCYSLS